MELKKIIQMGLVLFMGGDFIFNKNIENNKTRPGAACAAPLYISRKNKRRFSL